MAFEMIGTRWQTYVGDIERLSHTRNHTLLVDAEAPASERELAICEYFANSPLPESYKRFLRRYNGVELKIVPTLEKDDPTVVEAYLLDVFGTTSSLYETYHVREWFRDLENYNIEHYTQREATKYYKFGTFGPSDSHLLFDLSRTDPATSESPVIYVHVYDEEWTTIPPTPIAANFDEFLDRCLAFMVETEGGFMYFEEPDLSGWEP